MTVRRHSRWSHAALLAGLMSLPSVAMAQSVGTSSEILPEQQRAESIPDEVDASPRANWNNANYGPVNGHEGVQPAEAEMDALPPFGANLFEGGFRGTMADGLTPGYQIKPGDQVTLRAWGAVELDRVLPVDAQGNIFIPSIGPLAVQGMNSQQLDGRVRQAIQSVYPDNVQVYTNLQGVQPVGVFVTGYVENPGRYAGTPSDSVLYFLDQAGGIDNALGSYRQIRVMRDGRTLAEVDLYDFLLRGELARPQFRDGDTIVVEERGPAIAVVGEVERDYRYELRGHQLTGAEVVDLARLKSGVSHVLLRGDRASGPVAEYVPLSRFGGRTVRSGDEVLFSADQRDETIVVQLEGSYYGPSRYALPRDARLGELLDAVAVPETMTAERSISIKRESVAAQQQAALEESLRRLETTYLGASSSTNEEAQIRVREAELIQKFTERARQMEPSGRLVVAHRGQISDIRLQDGDVITIPEITDSVLISGEVVVPQAVVFRPGMSTWDYIEGAGGLTSRGDDDHVLVVRQNGAVRDADDVTLRPGDEILVMPEVPTKNLQLATSLTQILYQIAVATKVAVDL
ncbi:Polysialic acid transport protein KpsD precursor [Halomonas sp. THAF5a]|uniref:polysaccharide biosynthesis/export family protein n=1 Tax=Halomonas sp. THAF5a TaxID=2587844 RepID=UPI0012683B7D|nr:polysaccharide biosynthesis/export family protein [Halomonas sp. THAF5a]QFU01738.1 Polysialic acid transport protein KpsD precursor [Halomonas sp. THAF5a]